MTTIFKKNKTTGEVVEFMIDSKIIDPLNWIDITDASLLNDVDFLQKYSLIKISNCKNYYDDLRKFLVRRGSEILEIKADQQMQNNIDTWIQRLKNDVADKIFATLDASYYEYNDIVIPYAKCLALKTYIAKIRTEVASNQSFHIGDGFKIVGKIQQLKTKKEIDEYDFTKDRLGKITKKYEDFVL